MSPSFCDDIREYPRSSEKGWQIVVNTSEGVVTMPEGAEVGPELMPPFKTSLIETKQIVLPAMVHKTRTAYFLLKNDNETLGRFLKADLLTDKLNKLHDNLWLAGLPLPPRPLHRQVMMGRALKLTEMPDEHLVWHQTELLLKPLPDYLLCRDFWAENLCKEKTLYESATGFLLSYAWLIERKSDFKIAQDEGLISKDIEWRCWISFIKEFLIDINPFSLHQVNRRYLYGELRLTRLNHITRFLPSKWPHGNFVRGYISTSTWYQVFFESNFSWLLAVFAFFSMLLSAMQVGLAVDELSDNQQFENLSYGISLLAIASVFFGLALLSLVWGFLFCYHLFSTRSLNQRMQKKRNDIKLSA
ncbi:hypothetical protein CMQ_2272 [Grosmannia clavigera kw1407]|uniref:Subtilisin-like serine protease n=1 Tax=Grosmannia clavigera (strain kw1407 / UAMH 11150) TaxID=655863 RepID=F0XJR2_GROCL|nr:uncharacterized protein CMQ_2272 [Grosmannia clavigera kw1407]EFX02223.1 hypothetical protein CMQ_2272 [Grosmannia clavigera kw1407]